MSIVSVLVYILEAIFALGLLGSFVVLILTTLEDGKMLFEGEKKGEPERSRAEDSFSGRSQKPVTT